MNPLIDRYLKAHSEWSEAGMAVYDAVCAILGDDACEDANIDPADWDGMAIEIDGVVNGTVPTEQQIHQFWDLGFTVIRIDYKNAPDGQSRDVVGRSFSGDWKLVKGFHDGKCMHSTP